MNFLAPPGNAHYATVNDAGTILGEGGESWAESPGAETGPSPITLYDISDPTNPEELATISPEEAGNNTQGGYWSTSHNFEIRGDKLYSSWYHRGVKIHDISDPSNPEQIAWYANPDEMSFWTAQVGVPGEFFVATTFRGAPRTSDSALYTFPDEPGEMESPPQFPALQENDSENTTTEPSDGQATTTQPTDASTTAAPQSEPKTETMGGDGTTTSGDGSGCSPGLSILSALAGLGIGAWKYIRRTED